MTLLPTKTLRRDHGGSWRSGRHECAAMVSALLTECPNTIMVETYDSGRILAAVTTASAPAVVEVRQGFPGWQYELRILPHLVEEGKELLDRLVTRLEALSPEADPPECEVVTVSDQDLPF